MRNNKMVFATLAMAIVVAMASSCNMGPYDGPGYKAGDAYDKVGTNRRIIVGEMPTTAQGQPGNYVATSSSVAYWYVDNTLSDEKVFRVDGQPTGGAVRNTSVASPLAPSSDTALCTGFRLGDGLTNTGIQYNRSNAQGDGANPRATLYTTKLSDKTVKWYIPSRDELVMMVDLVVDGTLADPASLQPGQSADLLSSTEPDMEHVAVIHLTRSADGTSYTSTMKHILRDVPVMLWPVTYCN